jgi:hypothetical protein
VGSAVTIPAIPTQNGTVNTGGGGGGGTESPVFTPAYPGTSDSPGGSGGSGIVIIRSPSSVPMTVSPATNTVTTTPGGCYVATFTVTGTNTLNL